MATFYVATTGSDGAAGTSSGAPWATITRALDSAAGTKVVAGDTLLIEEGTYAENPDIDTAGTVTATTHIKGMAAGFVEPAAGAKPVILSGQMRTTLGSGTAGYFRIENIQQSGYAGGGWNLGNLAYMTLINCAALNNTGASGDGFLLKHHSRLIGCIANGNARYGYNLVDPAAEDCQFLNCIAIGNTNHGFYTYTNGVNLDYCLAHANGAYGFYSGVSPPSGFAMHNCTCDGNANGIRAGGRGSSVINCIISNNAGTGWVGYTSDAANCVARNNLYYANGADRSNAPAGVGDITGSDPLFSNYAGDDFSLASGSPAIAAGWPASIDIGAYQRLVTGGGGGLVRGLIAVGGNL